MILRKYKNKNNSNCSAMKDKNKNTCSSNLNNKNFTPRIFMKSLNCANLHVSAGFPTVIARNIEFINTKNSILRLKYI